MIASASPCTPVLEPYSLLISIHLTPSAEPSAWCTVMTGANFLANSRAQLKIIVWRVTSLPASRSKPCTFHNWSNTIKPTSYLSNSISTSCTDTSALSNRMNLSGRPIRSAHTSRTRSGFSNICLVVMPRADWTILRLTFLPASSLFSHSTTFSFGICSAMNVLSLARKVVLPVSGRVATTTKSPCLKSPRDSLRAFNRHLYPDTLASSNISMISSDTM